MKRKRMVIWIGVIGCCLGLFDRSASAGNVQIGRVIVQQPTVFIERDGKDIAISAFGALLREGDIVKTGPMGKAQIILDNVTEILLAPDTKLVVEKPPPQAVFTRFIIRVFGKIRARIQRTQERQIQISTQNAVIGIKGTDFVVEFKDDITTVATVTGLVSLTSATTAVAIDIPPGKMSSIAADGRVMPLREIAGDILSDVEIGGEKLSESDISGQQID